MITDDGKITSGEKSVALNEILEKWCAPLEKVFPTKAECPKIDVDAKLYTERNTKAPAIKAAKPKVFIPYSPAQTARLIPRELLKRREQK